VSVTVVEPELKETLVPQAKAVSFSDEDVVREWLAVSEAIGASPQAMATVEFEMWCKEEGISIFSTKYVFDYLALKAKAAGTKFGLHGLRACDNDRHSHEIWHQLTHPWPREYVGLSGRAIYARIPLPVLLTAQKLIEKFGERCRLYVTHLEKDDDPFLAQQ
jgi:hypothetical protein